MSTLEEPAAHSGLGLLSSSSSGHDASSSSRELGCVELPEVGDRHGEGTGCVVSPPLVFGVIISGTMWGYHIGAPLPCPQSQSQAVDLKMGLLLHCLKSLDPLSIPAAGQHWDLELEFDSGPHIGFALTLGSVCPFLVFCLSVFRCRDC